jgi:hypothetical protein
MRAQKSQKSKSRKVFVLLALTVRSLARFDYKPIYGFHLLLALPLPLLLAMALVQRFMFDIKTK